METISRDEFNSILKEIPPLKEKFSNLVRETILTCINLKMLNAKKRIFEIQSGLNSGVKFSFEFYNETWFLDEIISVINPLDERPIDKFNLTVAETTNIDCNVRCSREGKTRTKRIALNRIKEYVDPTLINPNEYKF